MTTTPDKGPGFYVGWVGVPTAIVVGAAAAISQGSAGSVAAGIGMLVTTGLILWRRFSK